jgi:hypothetical protein
MMQAVLFWAAFCYDLGLSLVVINNAALAHCRNPKSDQQGVGASVDAETTLLSASANVL